MTTTVPAPDGDLDVSKQVVPGLGPLESAVMLTLWETPAPLKVAEVCERLVYGSEPAHSTVATIMAILCRKRLARRVRAGRAFRYAPALSRDEYLAGKVGDLIAFASDPDQVVQHALRELPGRPPRCSSGSAEGTPF